MDTIDAKYEELKKFLRKLGSAVVAFSAGVDSALLAKVAADVLGDRMLAVTVSAPFLPGRELNEAREFCSQYGIEHETVAFDAMGLEKFTSNPPDRCYHCKRAIMETLLRVASDRGFSYVTEGSNVDDASDYRPGKTAIRELGIRSPLEEAGLTKSDIRELSRRIGLSTWDKPSFACLATRIPCGEKITAEKLRRVEMAEQKLYDLGFGQFRVRAHADVARIELAPEDFTRLLDKAVAAEVNAYFSQIGFRYTAMDILGYRTGSMNKMRNI